MAAEAPVLTERRLEDVVGDKATYIFSDLIRIKGGIFVPLRTEEPAFVFRKVEVNYSFQENQNESVLTRRKGRPEQTFLITASKTGDNTLSIVDNQSAFTEDKTETVVKLRKRNGIWNVEKRTKVKDGEPQPFSNADLTRFLSTTREIVRTYRVVSNSPKS